MGWEREEGCESTESGGVEEQQTSLPLSSAVGGIMPGDEDDKEAGGRGGCAAGISLDAMLSALYSSSEPRPLLELVTTASNRLSSRSIDDWLGLMMLTAGEALADDRPAKECSVDGTAKNKQKQHTRELISTQNT